MNLPHEPRSQALTIKSLQNDEPEEDYTETRPEGPTLLWRSAAQTVSLATGIATLYVRAGVGLGRWGLTAGRKATVGIIAVNQTVLETVLRAAGKDVNERTSVALRQREADVLVERWISALHGTLSAASVLAASGFYVAETALSWTSDSSLLGLNFLNSIFGCTETSRAVVTIIALMKQEYQKPGLDGKPNDVSTLNLLSTVVCFLFLQRISRRKTEIEWRASGGDVPIWDIVLDDKGFRADVLASRRRDTVITSSRSIVQSPTAQEHNDNFTGLVAQAEDIIMANPLTLSAQDQTTLSDEEIRQRIMDQLPAGTRATITTDTMTLKTVKVDIHGTETAEIEAPPGMVMVAERPNFDNSSDGQTVIFRTASKVQSHADIIKNDLPTQAALEALEDENPVTMNIASTSSLEPFNSTEQQTEASPNIVHTQDPVSEVQDRIPAGLKGPVANQKRTRKAVFDGVPAPAPKSTPETEASPSNVRKTKSGSDRIENPGVWKKALRSLNPASPQGSSSRTTPTSPRSRSNSGTRFTSSIASTLRPLTSTNDAARKSLFQPSVAPSPTPLMSPVTPSPSERDFTASGYFTVHEKRRESTYSEIDTFSVHSNDSRPPSPTLSRTHLRATNSISKAQSSTEISLQQSDLTRSESSRHHRRSHSFVPSLYSMGAKHGDDDALILASKVPIPRKSVFEDDKMVIALSTDGKVPGQFPNAHLATTLRRFNRNACAAYGIRFTKVFGSVDPTLWKDQTPDTGKHLPEHKAFAEYIGFPAETVIVSSHVDAEGLKRDMREGFAPIVTYITTDYEAKAIVLACRGTLGLEDLLTDVACDYADFFWQGQTYKMHRGVRDAARRVINSEGGSRVMSELHQALEDHREFGLILVGHSLGGAIAAAMAMMLSEPAKDDACQSQATSFVTATKPKLLPSQAHTMSSKDVAPITLPAGRQIQAFAYGSPAIVSSSLRIATRGLITSVVNANDIVPYLSLGTLHDLRAVAARLNQDISGAFTSIKQRASARLVEAMSSYLLPDQIRSGRPTQPPPAGNLAGDGLGEDAWSWNELVEMRKVMTTEKLYPPGEIFTLECTSVFDRTPDETTTDGAEEAKQYNPLGRVATRVQLKWVRDVERRFAEVRFGRTMFYEHSPGAYENNLSALLRGIFD